MDLDDYEKLHYSHSRICLQPCIHLYRPLLPVALSFYAIRDMFGVDRSCTFSQLLRSKYQELPKTETMDVSYDGERRTRAHWIHSFPWTFPERWFCLNKLFLAACTLSFDYAEVVRYPEEAVRQTAMAFGLERRWPFRMPERVGYVSNISEKTEPSNEDLALIAEWQERYNESC